VAQAARAAHPRSGLAESSQRRSQPKDLPPESLREEPVCLSMNLENIQHSTINFQP
jgi:hypothetical protein